MDNQYVSLATFMQSLRQNRNIQQKDIANGIGMSPSYLCQIESLRKPIPRDFITRLNDVVELNANEFEILVNIIANISSNKLGYIEYMKKELRLIFDKFMLQIMQGKCDVSLSQKIKSMIDQIIDFFTNHNQPKLV